ncbi:protein HEXIM-like [Thrips palmi]|uniref:Protein HEXIM-like n=1 Tax=Thrips palmi TaxID=161013 RepID=A0A6P8YYN5_THRPL|nr:protein HEXIM-like [Thrips palmi]
MDMETEDAQEIGMEDAAEVRIEVANDPSRRHDRHEQGGAVLPPSGVGLKLSVEMEAFRQERAPDESSAGTRTPDAPDTPEDEKDKDKLMDTETEKDKDKEKGRKRKKHRRLQHNKKVWLWKKELAAGGGGGGASPSSGRQRQQRPRPNRSNRSNAALPAPNNTTQFIMEDHTDVPALDLEALRGSRTSRARDSSFSIDSDEDFSSSPEDEAYLWKQFSNTYEDVHVERLGTMTKVDLIQEYLRLEQQVGNLEKKLIGSTGTDSESEVPEGDLAIEPVMAEKIRIFQEEIRKLAVENEQLVQENKRIQSSSSLVRQSSSSLSSSIDSESDSSTSSGSSSSSSSGCSGASRSSGSGRSHSGKSSPQSAIRNNNPGIELEDKTIDLSSDQDMESESLNDAPLHLESVHEENSTVSSVTAH